MRLEGAAREVRQDDRRLLHPRHVVVDVAEVVRRPLLDVGEVAAGEAAEHLALGGDEAADRQELALERGGAPGGPAAAGAPEKIASSISSSRSSNRSRMGRISSIIRSTRAWRTRSIWLSIGRSFSRTSLRDLAAGRDGAPVDGDEEAGAEVGGELVALELEPFLRRPQAAEEEEEVAPELLHLRRLDGGQGVLHGEGVEAADVGQLAGLLVGRVLDVDPDGAPGEAGPGGGERRVLEEAEAPSPPRGGGRSASGGSVVGGADAGGQRPPDSG